MKTIHKVGVVGAGTMGSALAQKFAQEGLEVVLVDQEQRFLDRGLSNIQATLQEGIERRLFTEAQVQEILRRIHCTTDKTHLASCDLVIEAIFEDFGAKTGLFRELSDILSRETLVATNTSSFSVTELAEAYAHPENFLGLHYFYHAAKNRLVEIIPGEKTAPETLQAARRFAELTGKDPILCRDRYGFAVNRFFVPWLNEAVRLLEEGVADTATIDAVCMKTFGIGMGPFALMNATGVPVAYHAQKTLEAFGDFYRVAAQLEKQAQSGQPWEIGAVAEDTLDEATAGAIRERMLGTVFLVCSQILEEQVCTAAELNRGARIGLRWRKGPVEMMQALGEEEVARLIRRMTDRYGVNFPGSVGESFWHMEFVELHRNPPLATILINRPEDLNALNQTVMHQLEQRFEEAAADPAIETIILTGAGKAFVAGADIKFFLDHMKRGTLEEIQAFTEFGQTVFKKIDACPKRVVALVNGLALGGGLELALCADVILAAPEARMAFPETGLGIYPGLGGTYRTRQRIGRGLTKFMIYTGKMLSAKEAWEIGLIDGLVERAALFDLRTGTALLPDLPPRPERSPRWQALESFFDRHTVDQLTGGECRPGDLSEAEMEKLIQTVQRKAPIALNIAERLIEEGTGPEAELEHLRTIFATEDALLGLSSMGKSVTFQGK